MDNRIEESFIGVEKELTMKVGLADINLGKFREGAYIVRAIVNNILVHKIPFTSTWEYAAHDLYYRN